MSSNIGFTSRVSWPSSEPLRSKTSAKSGSMPEELPAIIEIVPVGAIVVTVEFRSGLPSL
jgi:hypothetical protein